MSKLVYISEFQELFDLVQRTHLFEDQKTMADAYPLEDISVINEKFNLQKNNKDFDLKKFVSQYFSFNENVETESRETLSIDKHIEKLWDELSRKASENKGTLIGLPKPYLVPGGRFDEFFYWDSYFVMLGLQVSGRISQMKDIIDNCAFLINEYGFVPNANRSYFLTRSQPPFFSLMLELYAETINNEDFIQEYIPELEKEYAYWMDGIENLDYKSAFNKVVKLSDGSVLNRYCDTSNEPRYESYMIDIDHAKESQNREFMKAVRSACESGWDFSSRWFADGKNINSVETHLILPIDLNCLMWNLENVLAKAYSMLDNKKAEFYSEKADERKAAINKFFWDEDKENFFDYQFINQKTKEIESIACIFPLYFNLVNKNKAEKVMKALEDRFLKPGGLITTNLFTGQQWDAPNGWAPSQWMAYVAMKKYHFDDFAKKIKNNWCSNIDRVYENTHKLMEKYNVIDIESKAGGGEYPNQDGFGWTNAVYIKMKSL